MQIRVGLAAAMLAALWVPAAAVSFEVSTPARAFAGTFTGRVVVYLSKRDAEPRFGPDWFDPQPCYSIRVKDGKAGETFRVENDGTVGFPGALKDLPPGMYTVQAVVDRNLGGRAIGQTPGNLYSKPTRVAIDGTTEAVPILCDQLVEEPTFEDTATVKGVRLRSELLSKFYGHDMFLRAAVVLPADAAPSDRFPVVYEIPGFGGTHYRLSGQASERGTTRGGQKFITVVLNPDCPTGHSVFADSANNGPWGKALTTELIPFIEAEYPAIGKPLARFTRGHSSGGWSSLWLQVAYPDFFGGCWSTSPDPVDFRRYQELDIYAANANAYRRPNGEAYGVARQGGKMLVTVEQFSRMELPIRGEQLGSFDAVFSPRGADGKPKRLYDATTGKIDADVAKAWQQYDIWLKLKREWPTLKDKLRGKLHIYMGTEDTFYLDAAVRLIKENLKGLGSDAKVELFPGDHGSVLTPALDARIGAEMAQSFKSHKSV